jgi:hypothetical protein
MECEIVMAREKNGYRVLYGHLCLTALMSENSEIILNVQGTGEVKVTRTHGGYQVFDGNESLPILRT